jgi:hypothetical protein
MGDALRVHLTSDDLEGFAMKKEGLVVPGEWGDCLCRGK